MHLKILKKIIGQQGFTLLELIIVFSVIAIMSTVGIAAFVNYSKQQTLQASYLDLLSTLNTAKSYSISQLKPSACGLDALEGYKVSFDLFHDKYSFYAECEGYEEIIKTASLPQNITFIDSLTTPPNGAINFPILTNNISDCPNTCSITIDGYGSRRTIVVSGTGLITGSENISSPGSTSTPTPAPTPTPVGATPTPVGATPTPTPTPTPVGATPTPSPTPVGGKTTPPPGTSCTNNQYSCSGSDWQVCVNGALVKIITCPVGTTCNTTSGCVSSSTPKPPVQCGKVMCSGTCIPFFNICI